MLLVVKKLSKVFHQVSKNIGLNSEQHASRVGFILSSILCIYAASAVGIHLHPYAAPAARARGLRLPLLMLASTCTTMALWCSAPAGRMASNVAATAGQEFPLPSCGPTMFPSISQTPPLQQFSESKMLLPPKLESSTSLSGSC